MNGMTRSFFGPLLLMNKYDCLKKAHLLTAYKDLCCALPLY